MRKLVPLLALLGFPSYAFSQCENAKRHVYEVRMDFIDSDDQPVQLVQTGFTVKGYNGIFTALHGLLQYGKSNLRVSRADDIGLILDSLDIIKVDVLRDVALIGSPTAKFTDGFEYTDQIPKEATAIGFPGAIPASNLEANVSSSMFLSQLLKHRDVDEYTKQRLEDRASPSVGVKVIVTEGSLGGGPGTSGAPVFGSDCSIFGIIGGGIRGADLNWAIPISDVIPALRDREALLDSELARLTPLRGEVGAASNKYLFNTYTSPREDFNELIPPGPFQGALRPKTHIVALNKTTFDIPETKALQGLHDVLQKALYRHQHILVAKNSYYPEDVDEARKEAERYGREFASIGSHITRFTLTQGRKRSTHDMRTGRKGTKYWKVDIAGQLQVDAIDCPTTYEIDFSGTSQSHGGVIGNFHSHVKSVLEDVLFHCGLVPHETVERRGRSFWIERGYQGGVEEGRTLIVYDSGTQKRVALAIVTSTEKDRSQIEFLFGSRYVRSGDRGILTDTRPVFYMVQFSFDAQSIPIVVSAINSKERGNLVRSSLGLALQFRRTPVWLVPTARVDIYQYPDLLTSIGFSLGIQVVYELSPGLVRLSLEQGFSDADLYQPNSDTENGYTSYIGTPSRLGLDWNPLRSERLQIRAGIEYNWGHSATWELETFPFQSVKFEGLRPYFGLAISIPTSNNF